VVVTLNTSVKVDLTFTLGKDLFLTLTGPRRLPYPVSISWGNELQAKSPLGTSTLLFTLNLTAAPLQLFLDGSESLTLTLLSPGLLTSTLLGPSHPFAPPYSLHLPLLAASPLDPHESTCDQLPGTLSQFGLPLLLATSLVSATPHALHLLQLVSLMPATGGQPEGCLRWYLLQVSRWTLA